MRNKIKIDRQTKNKSLEKIIRYKRKEKDKHNKRK
jgi:hypothetical protein